jgi:predicted nuclease of predicted toxin-antitoxin system
LGFAREQGSVVITQDLDFSALVALDGHDRPNLITLRLAISDPETVTPKLLDALPSLEEVLRKGCVVTVDDVAVRIRRLPIG